jgi:Cof subfamily protein (haloacid dehalogenase superfamily)
MKYKAAFFDIDGTLVSFHTHRVPVSTIEALERARSAGMRIFISTGRPYADMEPVKMVPYDGAVALNGADCRWRDGRVVEKHLISYRDFRTVYEAGLEMDFAVGLELDEGIFVNRITPPVLELAEAIAHPVPTVCDIDALFREKGCGQMCVYFTSDIEAEVMRRVPGLVASRWYPCFADVDPVGVTKASGIGAFAREMGISMAETVAFGDGGNDTPMLVAAGLGVAMGNAADSVKSQADYVTSSVDDDGIARALDYILTL